MTQCTQLINNNEDVMSKSNTNNFQYLSTMVNKVPAVDIIKAKQLLRTFKECSDHLSYLEQKCAMYPEFNNPARLPFLSRAKEESQEALFSFLDIALEDSVPLQAKRSVSYAGFDDSESDDDTSYKASDDEESHGISDEETYYETSSIAKHASDVKRTKYSEPKSTKQLHFQILGQIEQPNDGIEISFELPSDSSDSENEVPQASATHDIPQTKSYPPLTWEQFFAAETRSTETAQADEIPPLGDYHTA